LQYANETDPRTIDSRPGSENFKNIMQFRTNHLQFNTTRAPEGLHLPFFVKCKLMKQIVESIDGRAAFDCNAENK